MGIESGLVTISPVANDAGESDSVSLQILWGRLIAAMDEVDSVILRTAFSTIVSDTHDYSVILMDRHARSIGQAQICIAAFTCSMPAATRSMLEIFPPETLSPGDVLITNDPWLCHGHLPDFCIVTPVFNAGEVVAYIGITAHISDIGGRLDELNAHDVYEEGLRIPPSKLFEAGRPNEQLMRLIEANVRFPGLVLGDTKAIVGAARIGVERYLELVGEYGQRRLDEVAEFILDRSEQAMRAAISRLPDGVYRGAAQCDARSGLVDIALDLTIRGDQAILDYTGTSAQRPDEAINVVYNVTHAHSLIALKCSLCPELPNNEGLFRPISTFAPVGSILNATFPAPVYQRTRTSFHTHTAIYEAMANIRPCPTLQAASGLFWAFGLFSEDEDGNPFVVRVLPNGGQGAADGLDGHPATAFPGGGSITPAEIIESGSPVLVVERSLRCDSGGAGRFRGGLGQAIRLRVLDGNEVFVTLRTGRRLVSAPGLMGGEAGALGDLLLDDMPIDAEPLTLKPGQELTLLLPGGGGYGDPRERDPGAVERDVELGFVSAEEASRIYGWRDRQLRKTAV